MRDADSAIARLRRALQLSGDEAKDAELIQALAAAFIAHLPLDTALLLERRIVCMAEAAEALGPDATPRQIVDLGLELERRPT